MKIEYFLRKQGQIPFQEYEFFQFDWFKDINFPQISEFFNTDEYIRNFQNTNFYDKVAKNNKKKN